MGDRDRIVYDVNSTDFFSDENFGAYAEAEGVDAVYADWAPTEGERRPDGSMPPVKQRPVGDFSSLPFVDGVETVDINQGDE